MTAGGAEPPLLIRVSGVDEAAIERARSRIRLTPGARTFVRTLERLGFCVGIVSGGFTPFTDWDRGEAVAPASERPA